MESKLTVLPEVAGDGLGLTGRLAEPFPHLAEHVLHGIHRICKTTPNKSTPEKIRTDRNSGRIGRKRGQMLRRGGGGTHSSARSRRRRRGRRCRGCLRRRTARRWRRDKAGAEAVPPAPATSSGTARTPGFPRRGLLRRLWTRLRRADSCRRRARRGAVRWGAAGVGVDVRSSYGSWTR